jgi:hypothetical protein
MIKDLIRYIRIAVLHLLYRLRPALRLTDKTVIIAPHPDDEVIGCAGLIQVLVERGTPPHVIILTGGIMHSPYCSDSLKRQTEFLAPIVMMPGEDEMGALAANALGALTGELPLQEYSPEK